MIVTDITAGAHHPASTHKRCKVSKQTQPPKGFRDFLPSDFRARDFLKKTISATYEQFGYHPIDTPVVEDTSVLLGKGGGENEKLMFMILKRGDKMKAAIDSCRWHELADMGLRFDLTVPLARFMAAHSAELPPVFKRYQIAPVWRADRPQHGRFREFYQCDIDIVGSDSMLAEADVILATATCLARLGFSGLELRLNNRPLVSLLLKAFGLEDGNIGDACRALDKIDKIGIDGAIGEMRQNGISGEICTLAHDFYAATAEAANLEKIEKMAALTGTPGALLTTQLREIVLACDGMGGLDLVVDPFLVRGMDYYTGPIFEVRAPGVPFTLAGGGRYDGLIGAFSGRQIPATGFSIGFERILVLMKERGMLPDFASTGAVAICSDGTAPTIEIMKTASAIRANGHTVDVLVRKAPLGKLLQDAENSGAKIAIIIRDKSGAVEYEIRDLNNRSSEKTGFDMLPDMVESLLGR